MVDADALIGTLKLLEESYRRIGAIERAEAYADCLWEIELATTVGGWISVEDRLPEEKENPYTKDYQEILCVLSTRCGTDVRVYKFGKGHFWNGLQEIDRMISHWMPFPELPKEESDD